MLNKKESTPLSKNKALRLSRHYRQKERACYVMLAPQIIGFLVFSIVPMVWAISLSFFNYNMIRIHFSGLENFKILLTDKVYWTALGNTFLYALMKIPIEIPLALILAVMLYKIKRGAGIYRAVYYLPHVISIALVALVYSNIFGSFGVVNAALDALGFNMMGYNWFGTKFSSMAVVVIADIWMSFGVNVLYFVAALANVPEDVYESAQLDGATGMQTFFKITIPMIAPTFQIILMLSIIGTLGINEIILVMTNGAPGGSTYSVQSYIFQNYAPGIADSNVNVGYGCAISLVTGAVLAAITGAYMKASSKISNNM